VRREKKILKENIISKTTFKNIKTIIFEDQTYAAVAQLVEHQLPKLRVVGSSPICRSS
jgi:hypothetical protein